MFDLHNSKSKFASNWCKVVLLCILFLQFWGYQHRVAHALNGNSPDQSISQFNTSSVAFEESNPFTYHDIKHHCVSWDHAVLGYGFSSLVFQIKLLSVSFGLKQAIYQSTWLFHSFSYLSRAPPFSN
jgi:hypothetical protein